MALADRVGSSSGFDVERTWMKRREARALLEAKMEDVRLRGTVEFAPCADVGIGCTAVAISNSISGGSGTELPVEKHTRSGYTNSLDERRRAPERCVGQ